MPPKKKSDAASVKAMEKEIQTLTKLIDSQEDKLGKLREKLEKVDHDKTKLTSATDRMKAQKETIKMKEDVIRTHDRAMNDLKRVMKADSKKHEEEMKVAKKQCDDSDKAVRNAKKEYETKYTNYKNKWTKHGDKIRKKLDTANKALVRFTSGEADKKRKHELDLAREKTLGEKTKRQKLQDSTDQKLALVSLKHTEQLELAKAKQLLINVERDKAETKRQNRLLGHVGPTFLIQPPLLPYMILLPIRLKKAMDLPPMNGKHSTSPVYLKALLPS